MILMGLTFFFFAILYNAETCPMWKIFSVPCGSALYKFHCTRIVPSMRMGPLERNCDLTWHPNYIGLCCRDGKTIRKTGESKVVMFFINLSKRHEDVRGRE
jgi:hypothetical protein